MLTEKKLKEMKAFQVRIGNFKEVRRIDKMMAFNRRKVKVEQ